MGKNTSISIGNHFEEFVQNEVKSGKYGSVSEVIRSALRLLEREEIKERELIKALEIGENSGFVENFDPKQNLTELHRPASASVTLVPTKKIKTNYNQNLKNLLTLLSNNKANLKQHQ